MDRFASFDRVGADREALAAHASTVRSIQIPLNQITAPTLVIAGDNDAFAARPEVLAASIPNARFLLLPGDHLSVVPTSQFASAIVEFLAS
jgi:pimeloyl-ACP methyl ester carboxylesterase